MAITALAAVAPLDRARATLYDDLIRSALGEAAQRALEAAMDLKGYRFQSEFVRKHFGEGHARGLAEGLAEGKAEALLAILDARGLAPTAEQRSQVLRCSDVSTLDVWIRRAATARTVDEVLG